MHSVRFSSGGDHLLRATELGAKEKQHCQRHKRKCSSDDSLYNIRLGEALEGPLGYKEGSREGEAALDEVEQCNAVYSLGDVRFDNVSLNDTSCSRVGDVVDANTTNDFNRPTQFLVEADTEEQQTNGEKNGMGKQRPETVLGYTLAFARPVRVSANKEVDSRVTEEATGELANQSTDGSCKEGKADVDIGESPRRTREHLRSDDGESDRPHKDDSVQDGRQDDGEVNGHLKGCHDLFGETDWLLPWIPSTRDSARGAALERASIGKRRRRSTVVDRVRVLLVGFVERRCVLRNCRDGRCVLDVASLGNKEQDADPKSTSENQSEVVDCWWQRNQSQCKQGQSVSLCYKSCIGALLSVKLTPSPVRSACQNAGANDRSGDRTRNKKYGPGSNGSTSVFRLEGLGNDRSRDSLGDRRAETSEETSGGKTVEAASTSEPDSARNVQVHAMM